MTNFKSGIEKIDQILKATLNGKVHIQPSGKEIENTEDILNTINEIKLKVLGLIEFDGSQQEMRMLIKEYIANKGNKRELRRIGIQIIRLASRVKPSYDKSRKTLKKVKFSDNVEELVRKYYTNEENGNLVEALLLESLVMTSNDSEDTEVVITPDLLDHKKIDFILRIIGENNDLKIGTQVTFTNGTHNLRKKMEVENLACELDNPNISNPHEQEHYRKIRFDNLRPILNPDLTSFISISTDFGNKLSGSDRQRLKKAFNYNLGKREKIEYLQNGLKDYEKELLRDISLGYIMASQQIDSFIRNGDFKKELDIPDSDFKVKLGTLNKENSSINAKIQYEGYILADITFFITKRSLKKHNNSKISLKKRTLKEIK